MVEITKILSEAFGKIRLSTISSIVFFVCRSEKKIYIITRTKKKGKRNNKRQKEEERIKRMKEKKNTYCISGYFREGFIFAIIGVQ